MDRNGDQDASGCCSWKHGTTEKCAKQNKGVVNHLGANANKGIMVSSNQCLDKYKYLKKAYKSFVDRANKSDAGKCSFKYENEVHQIMGDDPAVKPKYTVDTELEESENGASCSKIAKSDAVAEEIQLDSSMKAKPERKPGMLKELQVMMEQRDTRLLDAMKNMQKEQNGLMKQLIDKLWMY